MLELIIAGLVMIGLGVGIRLIPFVGSFDFAKIISNWLIVIPILAIGIISLWEVITETIMYILVDLIFLIFEYWYVTAFILFIVFLIWRIRKN
ncbi:MAG: hypothetical protein PF569_07980 [Candidatus Woesearchaeota archaeon]|jgi:hypothetical protein|nr:hypothetical protein [Candidatus Woesearchaeota archaeon]